jgi:4-phytase/acid phosphatase/peptide/nickel transport system substrate-binding protein
MLNKRRRFKSNMIRLQTICIFATTIMVASALDLQAAKSRYGGTLRFGVENEFAGFEVIQSTSRLAINGSIAANTIMEPLFREDENGQLLPVLGLSAEESDDGKQWTIKLRQGVRFHDGTPFNADAVVQHWQRMFDPKNKFRGRAALDVIEEVAKAEDYAVVFRLKHPWLPFKRVITNTRSLISLIPSPQAVASGIQNRTPVGTGPYRFKTWQAGDQFTVVKNPTYWQSNKPYLDTIVFKPMPDSQTRFASLKAGQLDIIWSDRGTIIDQAKRDDDLSVYQSDDNGAEIFIINTSKAPLDDINVRQALAYAHNQALQVKMAYKDSIPFVHHPFGADCNCPDDGYREYDPARARQMLQVYGRPLELEVMHSNSPRGREIGEITQQLMREVGINATPVGLNFGPVIKNVISGEYQISTWRISSRPDQGSALFIAFHSQSRGNFSRYRNPEMDRLLTAQRMETNPAKREELLCQIARLLNRDVPILYRGGMRSHIIARREVGGIIDFPHGILRLAEVWKDLGNTGKD